MLSFTLCPHWGTQWGLEVSLQVGAPLQEGQLMEPFVTGAQTQEQLPQQLLTKPSHVTPVTAHSSAHLTLNGSLGTSFYSLHEY